MKPPFAPRTPEFCETDAITALRDRFSVSPRQKNTMFTCDAELVEMGGAVYGLSMDAFSPEEDALPDTDPEVLGRNLAVAVIADVLAAGCIPEFYLHAVVAPTENTGFCENLARGVRAVLEAGNCFLLGGDFGLATTWRYTGFAMGKAADTGPLTRILPPEPQSLWVTGRIGDANRHALAGTMPQFEPRFIEAAAMRPVATACMDTSGGLADSLLMLARCNPGHVFSVNGHSVPYDTESVAAVRAIGISETALAFGGAGEYELLFTGPEAAKCPFATRIGSAFPADKNPSGVFSPGVFWNGHQLPDRLPDPRAAINRKAYIRQILEVVAACTT